MGHIALILPTRDGNLLLRAHYARRQRGFDPTYKGWKPPIQEVERIYISRALILPTRDGNYGTPQSSSISLIALILPTRDGNKYPLRLLFAPSHDRFDPTYKGWKRQ